ncbi:MAG: hypothetical protein LBJ08_06040, partial [Bifidobacteriaceae bacterium]|nr:hypothetical protein [Bifidobacteriaceae bacterium]
MPPPTPFRSRLLGLALALAAGGVGHLAFPSFDVWPAAIASIGLLWGALTHLGAVASFAAVFLYAMALYAPMFWWARVAAGTVPWAFLTVATALLVAIVGPAWSFARRLRPLAASPAAAAFAFAAIWTAVEELRAVFPVGGFPWGRLAFSQSGSPMLRLAWLG